MAVTPSYDHTWSECRAFEMSSVYLFDIFFVLKTGIDRQHQVQECSTDEGQIDGFVFGEVSIGEDVVPVDGGRQHEEATSERGQMA